MSQLMDVIVVGCGAAGVAALSRLHAAGVKVMGLEAAGRIGGRINTVQFGQSVVDIGAAWCHGEKDNVVFELANPLNLLGRPQPDKKCYIKSNGDIVPSEIGDSYTEILSNIVAKSDKNNKRSIEECVVEGAKQNATLQKDPALSQSFVEWFKRNNHLGGQTDLRQGKSLKGLEDSWGCEGEFMLNWKGRGYKTILDVLLKRHPDPSKELPVSILTNKEVESIKWKAKPSHAGIDHKNPLVQIKCTDGSLYAARSVIVTVSVGVLKERHAHLFNPSLPQEKITSIENLQLCVLDKIYIEFERPWWKDASSFTILWNGTDKAAYRSNEKWIPEVFGFNTVEYQPNVLLAWIYGDGAKEMERRSETEVREGIEKLIGVVFKKFDVAPVKNIIRSQWSSNPLARCAYAYRSVANEQNGGGAVSLSDPLYCDNEPIVCFAGEATSHHRHTAVHGAIESGFREADRLSKVFAK